MKVMTIVGTRPEIIRLSSTIKTLDNCCEHILVHTGQNYDFELNEIFFKDLDLRDPDYFLEAAGKNSCDTVGNVISKSYELMKKIMPDAVLVLGDTNSCMSIYAAKRLKIPTFHMEAGNRCFDQRVPEEINRKMIDHLSDINLTISDHAKSYLEKEGLPPNRIIKVGSSMDEVLNIQKKQINESIIVDKLGLTNNGYFVVSIHREENVDSEDKLTSIVESLNEITTVFNKVAIFSIHPRTKMRLKQFNLESKLNDKVIKMKPLGFNDYIKLQKDSFCTISDSGTISEEASLLNFPAITIRETHERPEAMDEGTIIMSGLDKKNIVNSIKVVTSNFQCHW